MYQSVKITDNNLEVSSLKGYYLIKGRLQLIFNDIIATSLQPPLHESSIKKVDDTFWTIKHNYAHLQRINFLRMELLDNIQP